MSIRASLRNALHTFRKAIIYIILGKSNYNGIACALKSLQWYKQIEPGNPLEACMLKHTDINEHLMTIYLLTERFSLTSILELGVRTGESTISLLSAAKEIGGTVTSIDIVDCPTAKSRVKSLGFSKWWSFIEANDLQVEWNQPIDHLFIDTSHTYEQTLKELQKYEPLVNPGGFITLHDIVSVPDILHAVNDYLATRSYLRLYKYFNNNGLAVISKGAGCVGTAMRH